MKKANLENLTKGTKPALHAAAPDWDVIKGLVQRAHESLSDARNEKNSLATRFTAGYSAAFWLARAALEACGYRLAGAEGHRAALFQSLANTVEWDASRWRPLDDFHRFRNRFEYGDAIDVPEQHVLLTISAAEDLLNDVVSLFPNARP